MLSDFDFAAFSHSALVRMADEVCLQMHLLYLSFAIAVRARAADEAEAVSVCTRGLIGIAGVAAERIHQRAGVARRHRRRACGYSSCTHCSIPCGYVSADIEANRLTVHRSPAHDDGSWISLCSPDSVQPLQAIATAVDPHIEVRVSGTDTDWTAGFAETDATAGRTT